MTPWTNRNSALLFLAVASLSSFLFFFKLGDRSLRNPDEGRYAEIAKEMVLRHDWVEPRLYGIDYLKKPVLFYWLLALSFKLFGFNEFAARFVPALFGELGVVMTFCFAKKVFDTKTGFYAALILTTNFWYLQTGRYLLIDMLFSFLAVAALYSFYLARTEDRHRRAYNLLFYVCVSLAFFAKGPVGIVIPGLAVVLTMTVQRRFGSVLSQMNLFAGLLIFSLIVLPWFILISLKEPEFIRIFFFHEHWARFVSSQFEHQEAWYYYFLAVPVFLIPWVLFPAPLVHGYSLVKDTAMRHAHLFLWASGVGLIVFFSLSKSKLPTYILPGIPLFSVLFGDAWARSEGLFSKKWAYRASLAAVVLLFFTACVFVSAAPLYSSHFPPASAKRMVTILQLIGGSVLVGCVLGFRALRLKRADRLFYAMIFMMALVSFPTASAMSELNKDYTTKPFAQTLRARLKADDLVFIYDHPGPFYDFRFYLGHPVKLVGLEGEFKYSDKKTDAQLVRDQDERESWVTREEFYEMLKQGKKLYCLIRKSDFLEMDPTIRQQALILAQDERKILFQTNP